MLAAPHAGQLNGSPVRSLLTSASTWAGLYVFGRGLRILILRDVEQLFDLVGYSAGDVLRGTPTYRQLRMDAPAGHRIVAHPVPDGPPPVLYRTWN